VFLDEQGYSPSVEETSYVHLLFRIVLTGRENIQHDKDSSHFIATSSTGEAVGTVRIHNTTGQVDLFSLLDLIRQSDFIARPTCGASSVQRKWSSSGTM
jgi:hypothetical protein